MFRLEPGFSERLTQGLREEEKDETPEIYCAGAFPGSAFVAAGR
jgi:hypothetical protein